MKENSLLSRRTALKGIGATGLTAAVGAGAALFSGGAMAQATTIDLNAVDVTNDNGQLQYVDADVTATIDWEGFQVPVNYVKFIETVTITDENAEIVSEHPLYETSTTSLETFAGSSDRNEATDPDTTGSLTAGAQFRLVSEDETDHPPHHSEDPYNGADDLEPANDDSTKTSNVTFTKNVRLYDGNEDPLTGPDSPEWGPEDPAAIWNFNVNVTDEDAQTSGDGSGSASGG